MGNEIDVAGLKTAVNAVLDHLIEDLGLDKIKIDKVDVLVQPEMERRRSPLVSIPRFGRGFSRHGVFDPMGLGGARTSPFIVSMSPPGYPSAWLRPRSTRFRFAGQDHCSSATTCRSSTSDGP